MPQQRGEGWGMGGKGVQTRLQRDKTHYRCDRKDNTRFSVQTRLLMDAQTQVSSLGVGVILVAFMGAGKGGRVSSGGTSKWKIIVVFLKPSLLLRPVSQCQVKALIGYLSLKG